MDAFQQAMTNGWFEEIRLDDIAREADVSVQTVIRRFGGKEGLLSACADLIERDILGNRRMPSGDVGMAIDLIIAEYEQVGSLIMRLLAQEARFAPIRAITDHGRGKHRAWVGEVFDPWLARLDPAARQKAHDRLVIALDLYIWKLVRCDMGRPISELHETMLLQAAAALGVAPDELAPSSASTAETIDA